MIPKIWNKITQQTKIVFLTLFSFVLDIILKIVKRNRGIYAIAITNTKISISDKGNSVIIF
jgi:hypothetical protein